MQAKLKASATVASFLFAAVANAATPPGVTAFVQDHKLTRYGVALADLNNDGHPEALIYAMATKAGGGQSDLCGSGGCDLYVLSLNSTGYQQVAAVSITHPPIQVLATTSNGWHDLGVLVAGGGNISGYEARLRFDGRSYPSNPTVPPATRLNKAVGKTVISVYPPVE
jgi:hypothetical protein